jgi:hypothetical protein
MDGQGWDLLKTSTFSSVMSMNWVAGWAGCNFAPAGMGFDNIDIGPQRARLLEKRPGTDHNRDFSLRRVFNVSIKEEKTKGRFSDSRKR